MSDITRGLWVRLFMFALWLTLAAGALSVVDPETDTAVGGVVLLAVIAGLSIVRPFPASHLAFAAVAALAYALVQGLRSAATDADPDAPYLQAAAVGAFGFAITAMVADQIRRSLFAYDEELSSRLRVIDEIQSVETETGAVKRSHAQRLLTEEVERARRYNRSLAMVLFGPDMWQEVVDDRGEEEATQLIVDAAAAYLAILRSVDTLIHIEDADFAALLPETDIEGAQVVAEKVTAAGSERIGTDVRAGVAVFPEDEVTGSGLMAEAEEALSFARTAHIGVASRSLLT